MVREVVEDMLLLDTESGDIHQLNGTASFIWRNCEEAPSVEGLAGMLALEFDVAQDVAARDVEDILGRLRALNLLVES